MFKKVISTFLCAAMLLSFSTTVKSSENTVVEPRLPVCSTCLTGRLVTSTSFTSWGRTGGEIDCRHGHPFGTDLELSRTKSTYQQCNNCGVITGVTNFGEYQWECHGFTN